jgi:lysozyme
MSTRQDLRGLTLLLAAALAAGCGAGVARGVGEPGSSGSALAPVDDTVAPGDLAAEDVGAGLRAGDAATKAPIVLPPAADSEAAPSPRARGVGGGGGGRVLGVDVSEYQGNINWGAVAASGRGFGIARVSDGLGHVDPTFSRNWNEMATHGLVRGVYQFFRPRENAVAQADLLVAHVGHIGAGDIPPVLDMEVTDGASGGTIHNQIVAWCNRIQQRLGVKPIVYTSPGFWNGEGLGSVPANLWVAHWFVSSPSIPRGFGNWLFWQYNDNSSVPGIPARVDGDEFHGTLADLKAFVGGSHTPPPAGSGGSGSNPRTYTVHAGDTLSGIASRFGVSLGALEAANPQITNPNVIYVGEVIHLPGGSAAAPAPAPKPAPAPASGQKKYVVHSGDSMWGISVKFHVSFTALIQANPQVKNPNVIYPNEVINIP